MAANVAIARRRGGPNSPRRIPWEYISFVLFTVFMVFFFLYIRALHTAVHHFSKHQHPEDRVALEAVKPKNMNLLILSTNLGDIKIQLREDLSKSSIDYICQIIEKGECPRCSLYRAEEKGILQGIIKNPDIPKEQLQQVVPGDCPYDLKDSKWKGNCHGPIMKHGMVGWAGGKTGPDFFIDWYKRPAKFWGAQHTVWGQVLLDDNSSSEVIDRIWDLPADKKGLTYLVEPLKFKMKLAAEE